MCNCASLGIAAAHPGTGSAAYGSCPVPANFGGCSGRLAGYRGRRQAGLSLLEVLIAVVVMAVGLLGIAGLQTVGIRNSQASLMISQATFLGNDMAERIRSNADGREDGAYNAIAFSSSDDPAGDPGCMPNCTAAQVAAFDVHQWTTAIRQFLPSGSGAVVSNADGTFTISVSWVELDRDSTTGEAGNFAVRFLP